MKPKLDFLGSVAGVLGVAVCILAAVLRGIGRGNPDFGIKMEAANIFLVGIALMVFACWLKLSAR